MSHEDRQVAATKVFKRLELRHRPKRITANPIAIARSSPQPVFNVHHPPFSTLNSHLSLVLFC